MLQKKQYHRNRFLFYNAIEDLWFGVTGLNKGMPVQVRSSRATVTHEKPCQYAIAKVRRRQGVRSQETYNFEKPDRAAR